MLIKNVTIFPIAYSIAQEFKKSANFKFETYLRVKVGNTMHCLAEVCVEFRIFSKLPPTIELTENPVLSITVKTIL